VTAVKRRPKIRSTFYTQMSDDGITHNKWLCQERDCNHLFESQREEFECPSCGGYVCRAPQNRG
jgi:rubrerythrin